MLVLQDQEAAPAEAVQALRAWVSFPKILVCFSCQRDRRSEPITRHPITISLDRCASNRNWNRATDSASATTGHVGTGRRRSWPTARLNPVADILRTRGGLEVLRELSCWLWGAMALGGNVPRVAPFGSSRGIQSLAAHPES